MSPNRKPVGNDKRNVSNPAVFKNGLTPPASTTATPCHVGDKSISHNSANTENPSENRWESGFSAAQMLGSMASSSANSNSNANSKVSVEDAEENAKKDHENNACVMGIVERTDLG